MNRSLLDPEPIDPDTVVADLVRSAAEAYRSRLAAAYRDPRAAFERFRELAVSRSLGEAAIAMRERPAAFGELLEGGEDIAREAAILGSRAYNALQAQQDPHRAVKVLDEAFTEVLAAAGGPAAAPRLRDLWDALGDAYGPDAAAAVVRRRPRDFFGEVPEQPVVDRVANIGAARDRLRERHRLVEQPTYGRSGPLPRSLADEESAPEPLPAALRSRIVAAADGMRARLVAAYDEPLLAEARLHRLFDQQGLDGIRAVQRDPATLGSLRRDLPAGAEAAAGAAQAALRFAEIAYQYHAARFPARAEELAAREALESAVRSARDPERGMAGIQEAIQLHGPELEEHLARRSERGRERGSGRNGPGGGGMDLPDPGQEPVAGGRGQQGDYAVEEAVRAFIAMQAAREEAARGTALREERKAAQEILARLDQQDHILALAKTDFRAAAANVYANPAAAFTAWNDLVAKMKGNLESAREHVAKRPEALGPLATEGRSVLGWGNTQAARDAVPRMLDRAVAYTRAQRLVTDPVTWTTPDGDTIHGREKVREAALAVEKARSKGIAASDRRVDELGGISESAAVAQRSYDTLSPEQRSRASTELAARGASGKAPAGLLPANVLGRAARAARVARDLGEGPASL